MKKRITVRASERLSLPPSVPAQQLKMLDRIGQVQKHIVVVVTDDNNQRNFRLHQRGHYRLNNIEYLRVLILTVRKITRNDDHVHILIYSRRRDFGLGLLRRKLSRIKSIQESTRTTPNMDIRGTQNVN